MILNSFRFTLLVVVSVFVCAPSYAGDVELLNIETHDKLYSGVIDEDVEIELYLKVEQISPNIGWICSLSGWYREHSGMNPTELTGIYTGEKIVLFVSDDKGALSRLLDFEYREQGETKRIDAMDIDIEELGASFADLEQRFILDVGAPHGIQGKWTSGGEIKQVKIRCRGGEIAEVKKYLKWANGSYFDLANIIALPRVEFSIEATANHGKSILLHYVYHSNLNYMGRCGGATDSGKIALRFDEDYSLSAVVRADFESCYRDIYVDDLIKLSEFETEYRIIDMTRDTVHGYLVNYREASISKIEDPSTSN